MNSNRTDIFISYCHADVEYLQKMKRHFSILRDKVKIWDDTHILAGDEWKQKIKVALSKARIAILLISADFLSSRFITEFEVPHLLDVAKSEGAVILPVILKPCLFSEYPELSKFQSINSPSRALSQMSESDQEETFVSLTLRLKHLIDSPYPSTTNNG